MNEFIIREATIEDVPVIFDFIKGLAKYEHLENEVSATPELLEEWIFEKKKAEVMIGEAGGRPVGFILYFYNFSTFLGRAGIYLEDLFVNPEERGKGYGKAFLKKLGKMCVECGYGRLEWACLNWNQPSIDFYLSMGAIPMDEWTVYRVTGEALKTLGSEKEE
ncbi:MAG: hypothetical protein PWQ12_1487 [Clostridiales bacterium]|jgi:GNAT superfamily N-acetyltransferase|nr:hypothetical protein [Clostridiales bacterium]